MYQNKVLGVFLVMMVSGCATTSLEELAERAKATGDWTAYHEAEQREKQLQIERAKLQEADRFCQLVSHGPVVTLTRVAGSLREVTYLNLICQRCRAMLLADEGHCEQLLY